MRASVLRNGRRVSRDQLPQAHRHRLPQVHRGLRILGRNPHQPVAMVKVLPRQPMLFRTEKQRHSPLRQRRMHRGRRLFKPNQRLLKLPPPRGRSADHQPAIRNGIRDA